MELLLPELLSVIVSNLPHSGIYSLKIVCKFFNEFLTDKIVDFNSICSEWRLFEEANILELFISDKHVHTLLVEVSRTDNLEVFRKVISHFPDFYLYEPMQVYQMMCYSGYNGFGEIEGSILEGEFPSCLSDVVIGSAFDGSTIDLDAFSEPYIVIDGSKLKYFARHYQLDAEFYKGTEREIMGMWYGGHSELIDHLLLTGKCSKEHLDKNVISAAETFRILDEMLENPRICVRFYDMINMAQRHGLKHKDIDIIMCSRDYTFNKYFNDSFQMIYALYYYYSQFVDEDDTCFGVPVLVAIATAVLERNTRYPFGEINKEDRILLTEARDALREGKKPYEIFDILKISDRY